MSGNSRRRKVTWALLAMLALGMLTSLVYVYSVYWSSLDWDYQHSRQTQSLAQLQSPAADGLYQVEANGLSFRIRVAGLSNTGPNLVLLHGFPESSIMWRPLIEAAALQGYRVIAYDQRGYSPGARPSDTADYRLANLEADLSSIADKLGFKSFHLVAHDWGAAVAWAYATRNSARVSSLVALSIPHTGLFFDAIVNDPEQAKRSAYVSALSRPWLPEFGMLKSDQAFLKAWFNKLPNDHEREYLAILREPGALSAALNWYRANPPEVIASDLSLQRPVTMPTLFIYGKQDSIAAPRVIARQLDYVSTDYQSMGLDARHNLMQQKTEVVVTAVLSHLRTHSSPKVNLR